MRIKECREKAGLSQKQVAFEIGVAPPQISKWEAGVASPSRKNCVKLAELFNVSVDYLLGNSDNPQEEQDEAWAIRERLRRDPSFRLLFDAAIKTSPEHLRAAAAMLKALEPPEDDDN